MSMTPSSSATPVASPPPARPATDASWRRLVLADLERFLVVLTLGLALAVLVALL